MMNWLFKEEPGNYSFDDLLKDRGTLWSGVRNPLAQKHLREIRGGDRVLYYHTGREKSVVGFARVTGGPIPDPEDTTGKRVAVRIVPVRGLDRAVTLAEIKATRIFGGFALVRISRLSVMPVSDRHWSQIEKMSKRRSKAAGGSAG